MTENTRTVENVNETNSWFSIKKINKSDKPFVRLTRGKRRLKLLESEVKEGILLPTF